MLAAKGRTVEERFAAHCALTKEISERVDLAPGVGESLSCTFARWDGKGVPRGVASDAVPMSVRVMQLADAAEVHHRLGGVEGAVELARRHRGKLFSPDLVARFTEAAPELLRDLDEIDLGPGDRGGADAAAAAGRRPGSTRCSRSWPTWPT